MSSGSGSGAGGTDSGDALRREIAELRGHIAQLSTASLRIGSSLDLDTVLREIAESARALTGARYASVAREGLDVVALDAWRRGLGHGPIRLGVVVGGTDRDTARPTGSIHPRLALRRVRVSGWRAPRAARAPGAPLAEHPIQSSCDRLVAVFIAPGFHQEQSPENPERFTPSGVPHRRLDDRGSARLVAAPAGATRPSADDGRPPCGVSRPPHRAAAVSRVVGWGCALRHTLHAARMRSRKLERRAQGSLEKTKRT